MWNRFNPERAERLFTYLYLLLSQNEGNCHNSRADHRVDKKHCKVEICQFEYRTSSVTQIGKGELTFQNCWMFSILSHWFSHSWIGDVGEFLIYFSLLMRFRNLILITSIDLNNNNGHESKSQVMNHDSQSTFWRFVIPKSNHFNNLYQITYHTSNFKFWNLKSKF